MRRERLRRIVSYAVELIKYYFLYPIALLLYRKHKIYLLSERGTDARDNGYHMFRYYREKHPEIECYYVISDDSPDRDKVLRLGPVIRHGSLQHYLLFMASEYKISTHIMGYSPSINFYAGYSWLLPQKGKHIFLQHGITRDDITFLYAENTMLSLFICGAKPEFDYVRKHFHYAENVVQYTGLARYDSLHHFQTKDQILIMPTWRMYLKGAASAEIRSSAYVKCWNDLLNDRRFINAVESAGIRVIFYPHYEMQPCLSLFSSESDNIHMADFEHFDVQELLKESKLLITDYSSVFFDFAYMKKPCIYYQFDQEEFYSHHYAKGYFDYKTMGFGDVLTEKEKLVDSILNLISREFALDETYEKRIGEFFSKNDTDNSKRIFDAIEEL